jgi:hypothetical protein
MGAVPRPVSRARLVKLVTAARDGTGPCLDRAVTEEIWGGKGPVLWRDWTPEAVATWDLAVLLYRAAGGLRSGTVKKVPSSRGGRPRAAPTPSAVWDAVR